ncbi:MAG: GDP-mannose dehydrogenase, partial [Alphaproteobacteria bacterium]|nr:GDP-mannose dehydrogenase [Alphaproteobacteria bacterium]
PGFAFGGSCLPKDIRALRASAMQKGLKTPIFDSMLIANKKQVELAYQMVQNSGKKKIAMLGLAFKAGSDDLRESPLVTLADLLIADGFELSIYDPSVSQAANMVGANQKYIREGIPHISRCLVSTPEELMEKAELCIVGNHGEDFSQILEKANDDVHIIDLVRLKNPASEEREAYTGICW